MERTEPLLSVALMDVDKPESSDLNEETARRRREVCMKSKSEASIMSNPDAGAWS